MDPDSHPGTSDDIVRYEWLLDPGGPGRAPLGEGPAIAPLFALGEHRIGLRVTDRMGDTDTAKTTVRVVDTTRPEIRLALDPSTLRPPNHRMVEIHADVEASDVCGPATIALVSVESSEPDDAAGGGDGDTLNDVQGAEAGTPDLAFALRAERAGSGPGRSYHVSYSATDTSGNAAEAGASVLVPRGK